MFKIVFMWTVTSFTSVVTSVLGKSVIADLRVENVNGGRIFLRYVWQSPTKLHQFVTERPLSYVV